MSGGVEVEARLALERVFELLGVGDVEGAELSRESLNRWLALAFAGGGSGGGVGVGNFSGVGSKGEGKWEAGWRLQGRCQRSSCGKRTPALR